MSKSTNLRLIGGIEGGGTRANVSIINVDNSEVLATVHKEGSTNLYHVGMDESCHRLQQLVKDALNKAGLDESITLEALGLSLSGCEVKETIEELKKRIQELYPNLSKKYVVESDTVGTLATASDSGMVLIAGTGSNALLNNPDGTTGRCGGWGHMLGDEGAAYYVAMRAVKMYLDSVDNMIEPPHDITKVKNAILSYFNIEDHFGILAYAYDNFTKSNFAGLCSKIAEEANNGDELSKWLFTENGRWLAKHVIALIPKMSAELLSNGLPIVSVGSVWKSWTLMEKGFMEELRNNSKGQLKCISLIQLKVPMSVGACYLAAKEAKLKINKRYDDNSTIFFKANL